jgi:hypothetical protein
MVLRVLSPDVSPKTERGHPVRLSAQRESPFQGILPARSERLAPAGGQDVRAPSSDGLQAVQPPLRLS